MTEQDPISVARAILAEETHDETVEVVEDTMDTIEEEDRDSAMAQVAKVAKTIGGARDETKDAESEKGTHDVNKKGSMTNKPTGDMASKNAASVSTKPSSASPEDKASGFTSKAAPKMEDYLGNLFSGDDLSEEFKEKAATIFEAAVNDRVASIEAYLEEQHEQKLTEEVNSIRTELTDKIDDYLNYVVEEWMKENSLAVERGIKGEIAENFISGLRDLFEENYIDIPAEKYDLVEGMSDRIDELEDQLNQQIETNIELGKNVTAHQCNEAFAVVAEDLADTQAEKLQSLAEGLEFETLEQFRDKLEILKENYFGEKASQEDGLEGTSYETNEGEEIEVSNPTMAAYAQTLSRTLKS